MPLSSPLSSPLIWSLIVLSQIGLVIGQILLKKAMARRELEQAPADKLPWAWVLAGGIGCLTVWFMLWLGLMHLIDLSQLMPLEGLSPILIVLGGVFFLGERFSWRGWLGIFLTCAGVVLVSLS